MKTRGNTAGISSAEMSCTVRKFNLDGSRITYKIVEYGENGPGNGILEVNDPVSMEEGQIVSCKADPSEDVQEILFEGAEPLEKYDPDGYRYI